MKTLFTRLVFITFLKTLFMISPLFAGNDSLQINKKGKFYFYWGYNRSIFSKSNIHVHGPGYDFMVYDAVATDRPEKLSMVYLDPTKISIPQFNLRLGYHITKKWAISLGYDHMKYVMTNGQTARVSGYISPSVSEKYAGTYLSQPMKIESDFLKFEHTDGLNLLSIDAEYSVCFLRNKKRNRDVEATIGTGGIWIVPRSDVRVFGRGLNNDFHVAGYTWTAKTGLRLNITKGFFFQAETRGGYITLPAVLVANAEPDIADHSFSFLEFSGILGIRF